MSFLKNAFVFGFMFVLLSPLFLYQFIFSLFLNYSHFTSIFIFVKHIEFILLYELRNLNEILIDSL